MGCSSSSAPEAEPSAVPRPRRPSDGSDAPALERGPSGISHATRGTKLSTTSQASAMSQEQSQTAHERLRRLQELDDQTKVPFILVELRGHAGHGSFVEISGKDEYGVYESLHSWLQLEWGCQKLAAGDLSDDTPLPFCDAFYSWPYFQASSDEGLSNMGLATMRLVDFMCNQLSWTLGVVNGGNVGSNGEIREQQVIFKAPHPMNLVSPHVMVELRSTGFVEICGTDDGAVSTLRDYFVAKFGGEVESGHEAFCDCCLRCASDVFKERGVSGENNVGHLTTQVCDAVVAMLPGWSLVTMNGGNYGADGSHREQQLVFRWDNHPLREAPHLLVELREAGYIEICGQDVGGFHGNFAHWLKSEWDCKKPMMIPGREPFCDLKLSWSPKDMMCASADLTAFFHRHGWQMQVCSQGTVHAKGKPDVREQQILFRPGSSAAGVVEPHVFLELYTGEGSEELYAKPGTTQVLGNQRIRLREVGDCGAVLGELEKFFQEYLGGELDGQDDHGITSFNVDVFLSRGLTDNNLGCWTMRVCDFMVDRLGWSFVVCNVCNLGPGGRIREQQLVFRHDGERRDIPLVRPTNEALDPAAFSGVPLPSYWCDEEVKALKKPRAMMICEQDEVQSIQEMFDATFQRILTRDRVYEYQASTSEEMPYRLEVVHAFRSENANLWLNFAQRRSLYEGDTVMRTKTQSAGSLLNSRLDAGEAYLAHGTNPSSAMAILKTGFVLANAGKATGTMFGYGIYLAECVSKSDEYARDDNGGTFPGLMAVLLCRSLVGNPYVVLDPGDAVPAAQAANCDSIIGDREAKVGTYREFVFFDERQVMPEFAVIYRRQYESKRVPKFMRSITLGTTGRNWQVQLEKGWANVPPDVSLDLNRADQEGKTQLERSIGEFLYIFDLKKQTQLNVATGNIRRVRAPMRK
ncbi:unnamed protein product [Polarella glacialis]|uniref:Poly [ADP-ribose] polymerase n=1 Tax=Polarella glacialis TaxID=89957 RepID=A0A813K4S2_POLGL|nr:unnamed protein product [Polarella glacialis]CAE8691236.1 unnamed protein product [Polarella glacialis]